MSTLKRVLAISLALMMALSVGVFGIEFKDQEDITADNMEAIEILVALDVLHKDGKGGGIFAPNDNVTRGEAAKMLYVLLNKGVDDKAVNYVGPKTFGDVASGHWAEGYIEYCFNMGIVAGKGVDATTGKRIFAPEAPVTGYEWAKMLLVAGNYQSVIRGYENNANWKQNIARDAMNTGLTDGYAQPLDAASLRQWAARMMATLVTKVEYAQYIGDLLITGTSVAVNGKTVGEQLLGLTTFKGKLTQTQTVNLGGGADEYDYSVVTGVAQGSGTVNVELAYNADADLLGQKVTVVAKKVNDAVGLTAKNLKVLSVYSANETVVHDLVLSSITFAKLDDGESSPTTTGVSIKFAGFNGGKAVSYLVANNADANRKGVDDFVALFYGNDYNALVTVGGSQTVSDVNTAFGAGKFLVRKGNDAVRVLEEDGEITTIFFKETSYQRVNSVNATRLVTNRASINLEDVNVIGAEPVKGDIVAVTERYETGDKMYDVRVIEPVEGVKVTKWTGTATDAASVTIDGTSYTAATAAFTALNRSHSIYYLDGKVAVASYAAKDDTTTTVNANLAVVTGVGSVVEQTNSVGDTNDNWNFKVQSLGLNGKVSSAAWYHFDNRSGELAYTAADDVWYVTKPNAGNNTDATYDVWADSAKFVNDTGYEGEANATIVRTAVNTVKNVSFVLANETTSGVYYTNVTGGHPVNYTDAAYVRSTGKLTSAANNLTVYVTDSTKVFFVLSDGTYKVIEGKDLYGFTGYTLKDYILNENTGDALAVLLTGTAAVPTDGTKNYAVITGSSIFQTLGLDDATAVEGKAALGKDGAFDMLVTDASTLTRWNVYEYTVGTAKHSPTVVKLNATGGKDGYISAIDVDKSFFMLSATDRYTFDENTLIFEIGGGVASVINTPYVTGASGDTVEDVFVLANSEGLAKLIIINTDGLAVAGGRNIADS